MLANPITDADEAIIVAWARRCRKEDQDDVAQEIRLAWLEALPRWDSQRASRRTFLNMIAKRLVFRLWQFDLRQARARTHLVARRMLHDGNLEDLLRNLPDSVHEHRVSLARGARRDLVSNQQVEHVLSTLTEAQREALQAFVEASNIREAAMRLRISHVALLGRIATIRKNF